jgi:hypothetical protein
MTRVLLGQIGSNGDCLYATTIARQIKHDFPGCHLTWAISSLCKRVIENNPDVDEVWEIAVDSWGDINRAWCVFEREAWTRVARGEFDHAFMTQICPSYFCNYDGTIRPSMFRNYPKPITVPVETIIALNDAERDEVRRWRQSSGVAGFSRMVLMECSSKSGQSSMTPALGLEVAQRVVAAVPDVCVVLSTHERIDTSNARIVHGGSLNLRQTAFLTHFADLFVGCGSGVTVAATSGAAKPGLGNIQILNRASSMFASFKHDFEFFGIDNAHFLETTTIDPSGLARIVTTALRDGIAKARDRFEVTMPLDFTWYFRLIDTMLLANRCYTDAARSLMVTAGRYGWRPELSRFALALVEPFLELDERAGFPNRRKEIERFRAELATRSQH